MITKADIISRINEAELKDEPKFEIEINKSDFPNSRGLIETIRTYCRLDATKCYDVHTYSHNGKITLNFYRR
jgi:hypothetical protein